MSIEELKQRFAAVPGIENLTMRLEGRNEVFSLGGAFVSVAPGASDAELEAAFRSVAPVLSTAAALPAATIAPVATPAEQSAAPAVVSAPVAPRPAARASVTPAGAHMNFRDMMEDHARRMIDVQDTTAALLQSSLDRQLQAMSGAVHSVVDRIDGQTDDFLSMMGQFTNGFGG